MKRTRLVMGNWKMNGNLAQNQALLSVLTHAMQNDEKYQSVEVVVFPSFPYLSQAQAFLQDSPIALGAQDMSAELSGAYTGEVSAKMLQDFACQWVMVGHSECRSYHGDTSEQVAQKAKMAIEHGMSPVVCVGETLAQRELGETLRVLDEQLDPIFALEKSFLEKMVIAYEPVWAIGTGLTATPEQAQEVHAFIRSRLARFDLDKVVRLVYGGSVKASNASALFAMPDIDGALVGGASLDPQEFLAIMAS